MPIKLVFVIGLVCLASSSYSDNYKRSDFNFQSYKSETNIGFYTGKICDSIDIDHIVSLRDAYDSGAAEWSPSERKSFANDRSNHVQACASVNRSKGASIPRDFLRKSIDGKGKDYALIRFCEYLAKYHTVKIKYQLAFDDNSSELFKKCDISLPGYSI